MPHQDYQSQESISNFLKAKKEASQLKTPPPMTFGMKLVGISFNPSGDAKVNKAKELCAELADLLYEDNKNSETSELKNVLLPATYAAILNAQMNVVKVLTLKY